MPIERPLPLFPLLIVEHGQYGKMERHNYKLSIRKAGGVIELLNNSQSGIERIVLNIEDVKDLLKEVGEL